MILFYIALISQGWGNLSFAQTQLQSFTTCASYLDSWSRISRIRIYQSNPDQSAPVEIKYPIPRHNLSDVDIRIVQKFDDPTAISIPNQEDLRSHANSDLFIWLNTFYHLKEGIKYFKTLGFEQKTKLNVIVNYDRFSIEKGKTDYFTLPEAGRIFLTQTQADKKNGQLLKIGIKDASVILHELSHWVVAHQWGMILDEQFKNRFDGPIMLYWALDEAFSDYFAATLKNNPIIGGYHLKNLPNLIRDLSQPPGNENFVFERHHLGLHFGHAFWTLRQILLDRGISIQEIDQLIFESYQDHGQAGFDFKSIYDFLKRETYARFGYKKEFPQIFSEAQKISDFLMNLHFNGIHISATPLSEFGWRK